MKRKGKKSNNKLEATLLGRMQARWLATLEINSAENSSWNFAKKKLLEVHRDNSKFGRFLIRFFSLRETWKTRVEELPSSIALDVLAEDLERTPWTETRFVEVEQNNSSPIGVFIYQEKLENSGRVYEITVMREEKFPKVLRAEVRACVDQPEPFLSLATTNGYIPLSRQDVVDQWDELDHDLIAGLLALHFLNQKKTKVEISPKEAVRTKSKKLFSPPHDSTCDELIRKVALRKTKVTQLTVPLNDVSPADYEYSILFPAAIIRPFLYEIRNGDRPQLLVYWDGKRFISSDDYAAYLAYRALKIEVVPVVVMGDYPFEIYGQGILGGPELLPSVTYRPSHLPSDSAVLERILDNRLHSELTRTNKNPWFNLVFQLHKFLNNPLTKERALHNLLIRATKELAIGTHKVFSEIWLGKKYRMDLAIQLKGDAQRILLVELERANLPLFTKSGAPYAHVTHAMQQVEDWIRFWQESPEAVPHPLDATVAPSGVVVLGRSKYLSEDEKRRLLSLNANRRVKLITYDELAERLETLAAWND